MFAPDEIVRYFKIYIRIFEDIIGYFKNSVTSI